MSKSLSFWLPWPSCETLTIILGTTHKTHCVELKMQSPNESDGSEEYFDAEDSTPHRLVKYVQKIYKRIATHVYRIRVKVNCVGLFNIIIITLFLHETENALQTPTKMSFRFHKLFQWNLTIARCQYSRIYRQLCSHQFSKTLILWNQKQYVLTWWDRFMGFLCLRKLSDFPQHKMHPRFHLLMQITTTETVAMVPLRILMKDALFLLGFSKKNRIFNKIFTTVLSHMLATKMNLF